MIWPWLSAIPFGQCPSCSAIEADFKGPVVGWKLVSGRVRTEQIGSKYQCMRCGYIYAIGPTGNITPRTVAPPITAPDPNVAQLRPDMLPVRGPRIVEMPVPRERPAP